MSIAMTVQQYLEQKQVPFDVLMHPYTRSSMRTAEVADIPSERLAKAVLLEDTRGYLMAVVPANRHVHLGRLRRQLGRELTLASEQEVATMFADCMPGAIPPLGMAYGMEMIWDDSLMASPEVYLEAGNHQELIHMGGEQFMQLCEHSRHGQFCH